MASDIIAKKRKIRSGHKAYTTKLLNEAKEFQFTDGESSSEIKDKLRQLERSLKERLNILSGIDEEILNATEDEEAIMEEIETAGQFRDGIHAVLVKIEEQLKDKPSSYNLEAVPVSKSPSKETVSTRLPKLILRKFAGEPKDWIPFWDQFKNAVHENTSLSEVDKFNYLKSLLEGNAATTIQAIALTAANYESAVQLLHQRFGNKQVIISSHMDALLRLHAVGSHDIRALRKTYDKIEAHVKGLQALDVPTSTYGSLLVPVLMSKIPEDIRLLLGREVKDGEWDLDKILDLLREEVENRERCGGIQALSLTETRKQGSSMNASHKSNMTTAAALIVNEKKVNCSYCRGNHTSAKCHVVTNVNARKDILRKEGRCFICLKRGHLSRSCDAKYSCSRCSSKHHISICDKHYGMSGMSNIEAGNAPHSVNTRALNIQEGSSPRARSNQITHNFNPRSTCPEGNSTSPMAQAFVPYPSHSLYAAQTPTRLSQNVESTGNPTPVGSLHMSGKEPVPLQTTQAFVPNQHSFYAGHTQSLPQQAIPTDYPTTTSSLHVSAKDSVLLQTAQAYVGTERIRLIFDSGSQKSYVTERIRSKLGLQPLDKESLLINTFGSADKGKPTVCDSVGLTVLDVKGETSTTIKALVVPTICAPLGKQEIKKAQREYDYIRNLEMADSNNDASEVHIDLLIGADYMWKFFTGKTRQGIQKEGPVASETVLGWVLSGPVPSSHSSKLSSVNFVSTGGGQTEKEALELYREAKTCFANGMFNLRKWVSNDKTLISRIKQDRVDREEEPSKTSPTVTTDNETYAKTTLGHLDELDATTEYKVLGLNWNLEDDKVYLKVDAVAEFAEKLEPTKRNVLKIAAKMFDPLGIISPVMVNFRFLLQELCVAKYDWDTLISTAEQRQLKKWLKSLESVGSFAINRYYFSDLTCDAEVKHVSLHGFGDASKKGYCAVVYLCIETTEGYQTSLVASKSRVAPIAPTTIPRLELVAALILSRLMSTIKQALSTILKIEQCRYWTDSKTVLYWITSSKEYKQFVQNRVDEIHSLTNTSDWGHCPGVENPADLGSRGCLAIELLESKAWWEGPPWLRKAPDNYPKVHCSLEEELPEECTKERRLKMDGHEHNSICLVNTQVSQGRKVPTNMSEEFKPEKYISFFKLLRVTATVWRFIKYLKSKLKKETVAPKSGAIFTTKELRGAEEKWIHEAQRNLKNHKNLSHQLGLFKDGNNILRCSGRLANAPLKEETKFPILLPKEHHITKLIVEDVHYRLMHGGVKETLAELREKYWIPRGRGFIKRILHKCVTCRKTEGKAFNPPSSANLPENRVANLPAFTHVGVDFVGPLYVKKEEKKTESSMKKVYICLFVCASSRALHLELCPSLSADAFNRCLRRFIARRGVPTSITSDNAKTFRHAAKEISNLFKSKEVRDFTEQKRIDWKFILEKAPWWGGFYERMVQLVKRRLRKVLGNAKVTYEELSTLLAEIEGILNSRPITYVYADVEEEPLTPAHLLIGRRLTTLPEDHATSDAEEEEYNAAECLTRRARYVNKLLQHFWQRWRREYLVDLREYHNLKGRSQSERNVKVGDIVIVQGDDLPRAKWRTEEVKELLPSRDGETRGVTLRVLNKKGSRVITLRRPVQQLYPLEVTSHRHSEQRGGSTQDSSKNRNTDQVPTRRDRPPRRAAAQNADFIRKLVDQ